MSLSLAAKNSVLNQSDESNPDLAGLPAAATGTVTFEEAGEESEELTNAHMRDRSRSASDLLRKEYVHSKRYTL